MMRSVLTRALFMAMFLSGGIAFGQIPVEVFAGHKKTSVDIMFFKFFKKRDGQNSSLLFFNRNRASVDYSMTDSTNLPQFGFTEAFSYNHGKLKGFAPVMVAQVVSKGVYSKAGLQFVKIKKSYTVFSWFVSAIGKDPVLDFFLLARFTPRLSEQLNLFTQLETFNALPTAEMDVYSFAQRVRLGLKIKELQFGAGVDLSQAGRSVLYSTKNFGGFLRYEF